MKYTREQKAKSFDTLPADIKDYFLSDELNEKILEITRQNSLHLDMAAVLGEHIYNVILGLERSSEFEKIIRSDLSLAPDKITEIVLDVNNKIFLHIRKSIQDKESKKEQVKELADQAVNSTNKEVILSEIENPTPVRHPFSTNNPTPKPKNETDMVANDFIAGKLQETVNLSEGKPTTPAPEKPKQYKVDPYREAAE